MTPKNLAALPFVAKWIPKDLTGLKILDYACGHGRHGTFALERGGHVTFADQNLEPLGELAAHENVTLLQADLELEESWPLLGRKFDVVIVTNYLFRPRLKDMFDLAAAGGILIYQTFALGNEKFGRPSNPDFLLKEGELLTYCAQDFTKLQFEQGEIAMGSLAGSSGGSPAVVQRLVAQRK